VFTTCSGSYINRSRKMTSVIKTLTCTGVHFSLPYSQYAAIFIISVIMTVFGFLQPYKSMCCNILEALLSLDVLVLLLLRNTEQITDQLQVPAEKTSNGTTGRVCTEVEGITGFSWLLFPFYYFPLAVFLIATTIWIVVHVRWV